MNRRFWIDVILATAFILAFMWGASKIFDNVQILDPVGDALGDIEITDLVFSQLRTEPHYDENIVLVNIGDLDREGIAKQLDVINQYDPLVIGIDALLDVPSADPKMDSIFALALSKVNNIVLPYQIFLTDDSSETFDSLAKPLPEFRTNASKMNFVNLITEAGNQEQFKVVRSFPPKEETIEGTCRAFGVVLSEYKNPELTKKFLERDNDYEIINFKRNTVDLYNAGKFSGKYFTLDWKEVIEDDFEPNILKNKIVIMGYLGEDLRDTSWDDKFLTPLNENYTGRTNPDMYGPVVHANIVSMILEEDYIDHMNWALGAFVSVIMCFLNVALFSLIYHKMGSWYDGITKFIQLIELFIIFSIIILVFNVYNYKLDLTIGIVAIILSSDVLEIYFSLFKNSVNKLLAKFRKA